MPFAHFGTWQALPQFGFGIRFHGATNSAGAASGCPEGGFGSGYMGVGAAVVVNNYVANDTENYGTLTPARASIVSNSPLKPDS